MTKLRAFCMPKWGIEMTEGTVTEWLAAEGAALKKGDMLCLIETAKITNEVEAERDGMLLRIVEPAGEELPVGTLLAVLGDGDAAADEIDAFVAGYVPADGGTGKVRQSIETAEAVEAKSSPPARATETNRPISPKALALAQQEGVDLERVEGSGRDGRITFQDVHQFIRPPAAPRLRGTVALSPEDRAIFASPLARRLAELHGIDLSGLTGTGPRGRISKSDVLERVERETPPPPDAQFVELDNSPTIEPFDKLRKVVARRLTEAKRDIPHFYLRTSARADELLALRKTANLVLGIKASVNDLIVMTVAKALAAHPDMNVQVHGDELHRFPHADIGIAVDGPSGLVAPILRQAGRMTLPQLAAATADLVGRAREGKLGWQELDGGTFTVSNLGMFGIENFDAIVNPPQAAILAVGKAQRAPSERADGSVGFETRIALTLSLDHRAIDGARGARFLATLVDKVENPAQLFG